LVAEIIGAGSARREWNPTMTTG